MSLDFAALLADPASVPSEQIPALLGELERLKAVLWARLVASGGRETVPVPTPRYLTQAEAARMFNVPLSTVRYLTRRGRVPALGQGKNRRLLAADLSRYLEEYARTGRPLRPAGRPAHKRVDTRYANGIEPAP